MRLDVIFERDRFKADPGVLGQTLNLNNYDYTIIGVAQAEADIKTLVAQLETAWPQQNADRKGVLLPMSREILAGCLDFNHKHVKTARYFW
jgi:hypothetical protein